jgi:hypothetical protein
MTSRLVTFGHFWRDVDIAMRHAIAGDAELGSAYEHARKRFCGCIVCARSAARLDAAYERVIESVKQTYHAEGTQIDFSSLEDDA